MELRFARIRMREMLNALHAKLFLLDLDLQIYPNKHLYKFSTEQLIQMQNRSYFTKMGFLNNKFTRLMTKRPDRPKMTFKLDAVLNLSSTELTEENQKS